MEETQPKEPPISAFPLPASDISLKYLKKRPSLLHYAAHFNLPDLLERELNALPTPLSAEQEFELLTAAHIAVGHNHHELLIPLFTREPKEKDFDHLIKRAIEKGHAESYEFILDRFLDLCVVDLEDLAKVALRAGHQKIFNLLAGIIQKPDLPHLSDSDDSKSMNWSDDSSIYDSHEDCDHDIERQRQNYCLEVLVPEALKHGTATSLTLLFTQWPQLHFTVETIFRDAVRHKSLHAISFLLDGSHEISNDLISQQLSLVRDAQITDCILSTLHRHSKLRALLVVSELNKNWYTV